MTSLQLSAITALIGLLISTAEAAEYQPLPGSFRPPSAGGTNANQSGFPPANSRSIAAPSQQQAWTSQPYGNSPNYYLPTPQVTPQYQQQYSSTDSWNRSININPGNMMNDPAQTYYQQPAYQQPIQQAPAYQQQYHYGSTYPHPERYSFSVPQVQPAVTPSSPPVTQPTPFTSRPFGGGKDARFRPPDLEGTN